VGLVPQIAWVGYTLAGRHSQLEDISDLPREAAAAAIHKGQPDLALAWLEEGRSVVWNQLVSLRTPADELRQAHPDLYTKFENIARQLDRAGTREQSTLPPELEGRILLEEETQKHHRLAENWSRQLEIYSHTMVLKISFCPKRSQY